MNRCLSCGGTYDPISADGVPYFHVCPPITAVRAERNGKPVLVELAALRDSDVVNVQRDGAIVSVAIKAIQADDLRLGDTPIERPNKRDERPARTFVDGEPVVGPKEEGAGVEAVPTPDPIPLVLADDAL